jgi:hypothetical protein
MTRWVRWPLMMLLATLGLFLLWGAMVFVAMLTEPESNRAYAETWRGAPATELIEAQGLPRETVFRSDGGPVIRYHLGPWRGLKGRTYPGSAFNALFGNRYMQSGVHLYTAPAHTYCDIEFVANAAGVIEEIAYSGNDCG